MLKTILVPLDGSKFSETTLPLATAVAQTTGASLHLVQVHVPYEPEALLANTPFQFEGVNMAEYDAHRLEQDRAYIGELGQRLRKDGICVEAQVLPGLRVASSLAEYADEHQVDMIFMATHGHSGVSRLWLGSVADELIRKSRIPVLVSHPDLDAESGMPAVTHILVALDGSDLAESVLGAVSELAHATGARITLVHVVALVTVLGPRILPLVQHELEPELERAAAYLERMARGLRDEGLDVDTKAVHGKTPALALPELADRLGADVIAMATHGYGGLKRALLGSVADKVVRSSPLPVLAVRPAVEG